MIAAILTIIKAIAKAIAFVGEEIADFFMINKFGPGVGVVATMAIVGFGGPALVSLFS